MNYPQQKGRVYPDHNREEGMAQANAQITTFAKQLDIPPSGVTILGGRPYVNKIGLLSKAHQIGLKEIRIEQIKDAWDTENMESAYKATVTMKDGSIFEDEGWASLKSVKMSSLHNADYINMTAITRAKNRALGSATGCGFVSAEELETGDIEDIERGTEEIRTEIEEVMKAESPPKLDDSAPLSSPSPTEDTTPPQQVKKGVTKQEFDDYKSRCFEYVDENILKKLASNLKINGKKRSEITTKELDDLLDAAMHFAELKKQQDPSAITPFPVMPKEEDGDDVDESEE